MKDLARDAAPEEGFDDIAAEKEMRVFREFKDYYDKI